MWGVLILVSLAGKTHADTIWDVPDSLGPEVFVEAGVDTDIGGSHLLHGELTDSLDGTWGPLLESDSKDSLVDVDGVLAGQIGRASVRGSM